MCCPSGHRNANRRPAGSRTRKHFYLVNKIVVSWRNGGGHPFQKISTSDIERIIHIIDTDGAFIPDSAIIETDDDRAQYFEDSIHYYNRSQLVGRNHKKAKVIRKLLEVHQVDNIPYSIYFASCNMDHLLFDQRNLSPNDKTRNAFRFASECKEKENLNSSIFSPKIGTNGSFAESWEIIQQGYNSLNRYTNLNIFLNSIIG